MGAAMFETRKRRAAQVDGGRDARLAVLARVPQLSACSRAELERIEAIGTEVWCRPGTVLQRAHHGIRQVVVVLEGDVLVSNHAITATRGAGSLVGEEALRGPRSEAATSVAAASPVRALVLGLGEIAAVAGLPGVRSRLAARTARAAATVDRRAWAGSAATLA
jgi:CRP-like cAMP-binding protein